MSATTKEIATVLTELGSAIRGDWSQDGRGIQAGINCVVDRIISDKDSGDFIAEARDDLGICPRGMGHWTEYCEDGWCGSAEAMQ